MSEIPILGSTRTANVVWEVTASDSDSIEEFAFGIMIAYGPESVANRPAFGTAIVNVRYAPATTVTTASATAPIPRFIDTSKAANFFRVQPPVTWLLFPGLSNRAGNDSALAFTNRSQAPGTCILQILSEGRQVTALKTPIIGPGEKWGTLLGLNRPGGEGCGVAACLFRPAEAEFAVFPLNFPATYSDENKERIRRGELKEIRRKPASIT